MNRPHGERDQHDQDGNTIAVINFDEMPYPEFWRRHDVVTFSALPQYAILSGNCWQMASGSTWCYLRQKITPVWWDWRIPTKDGTSYYYQKHAQRAVRRRLHGFGLRPQLTKHSKRHKRGTNRQSIRLYTTGSQASGGDVWSGIIRLL